MTLEEFLQHQISLNRKFKIIEIGAGVPFAEKLFNIPGCSKIIYETESPYGSAKEKYGIDCRMVSQEAVRTIIEKTDKTGFNILVVTSFQINSKERVVQHGWIGIWSEEFDFPIYLHVTLSNCSNLNFGNRVDTISNVGNIVYDLICNYEDGFKVNLQKTHYNFVDNVIHRGILNDSEYLLSQKSFNNLICFENGEPIRFEDMSRKYKQLNLYKGSFNPIHSAHKEIAKFAEQKYENSRTVFAISRNTYDKGRVSEKDLLKRISKINFEGYPVLIFDSGYIYDNFYMLKNRFDGKIVPIMGADTFNRFMNCYVTGDFGVEEERVIKYYRIFDFVHTEIYNPETIKIHYSETYEHCFGKVDILVFGRDVEIKIPEHITPKYEYVDFDMKISSTQIRKGIVK